MIQLVVLVTIDNELLAYRFASDNIKAVVHQEKVVNSEIKDLPFSFSSHTLYTSEGTLASLQDEDPYFDGVTDFTDLSVFTNFLKKKALITDMEVACYLKANFNLHAYPLQKVLYYSYSDYLEENNKKPFLATFEAFDHGPVDRNVWEQMRKLPGDLEEKNLDFLQKVSFNPKIKLFIDESVKKYADFFDKSNSFADSTSNPTHNPGTPWSIAYANGRNTVISDKNIIQHHYLERLS